MSPIKGRGINTLPFFEGLNIRIPIIFLLSVRGFSNRGSTMTPTLNPSFHFLLQYPHIAPI